MYKFGSKAEVPLLTSNKKWRQWLTGLVLFSCHLVSRKVFSVVLHLSEKPHQVSSARASQWVLAHNAQGEGGPVETSSPEGRLRLLQWDLYDVLLDDVALRNRHELGGLLAAHSREGAAPGERERAPERHPHGLPAGDLPPFPRLPLQTLDSLRRTTHGGCEVKGSNEQKMKLQNTRKVFFFFFILTCTTVTQGAQLKLQHHHGLTGWARFLDNNET